MSQDDPASRSGPHSELQLLLARARDHRPVMGDGLERESLREAPRPESLPDRVEVPTLEAPDAAPNNLAAQRWGVIAPEGPEGDALLGAVSSLIKFRAEEQGAEVKQLRACPRMDAAAALKWRNEKLRVGPTRERPKYLLILGDLPHISVELQQVLAHSNYVGRLHVGKPGGEVDLQGYAAYAEKVVAQESRKELDEAPEVLLYTAEDGTEPTRLARTGLVQPCLDEMQRDWKKVRPALGINLVAPGADNLDALLRAAGAARSGVMLSAAHGLGRPDGGWASRQDQQALQGALMLGPNEQLTGDLVRETPFLPGGMWFSVACFGAATPAKSVFHPWLSALASAGVKDANPQAALESLPQANEAPFMAALPQALLANPRGPLAIISHCDLAWVFSFGAVDTATNDRASRILSSLEVMANGSRVGVALDALMRFYREVNDQLMLDYEDSQTLGTVQLARRAYLWMMRNDLRGYLLLGDPAARLAVKRSER